MTRNYELDYAIASKIESFNDPRDVRALTRPLKIEDGDGPDDYIVHSSSGNSYDVNTRYGRCSCYDHTENGNHCYHLRAVSFHQGLRPVPIAVLFLDDVAAEVITEDNEVDADESEIADYAEIALDTVDLEPRTKFVDADGELIAESQPEAEQEAEPPEVGADLDAEREMVEANVQHAADGGTDTDTADGDDEIARCGSTETASGEPCQKPTGGAARCHLHRDGDEQDVEPAEVGPNVVGMNAATDGGRVEIETGDMDVVDRVLERAGGEQPIVVVVNQ